MSSDINVRQRQKDIIEKLKIEAESIKSEMLEEANKLNIAIEDCLKSYKK
jgi:hypothetical protein